MNAYHDAVRRIEEHLMNSWPSLRTVMFDGWVFREAMGYTKRANSAMALHARGRFAATLDEAERFYTAAGGPTIFRLTPLAGAEPDGILADRGYGVVDETIVMTTALADIAPSDGAVTIAQDVTEIWERGYADAHALTSDARRAHRAILERIAPFSKGFAVTWEEGRPVAFGLGVIERGHLGLFDIVTAPDARRKGAARRLVGALMRWGAEKDATTAWLGVIADNERAKPLYAQLGFREIYRYHYRVSAQQAA
ncbi:MAG TPA: GNAT family N-acetyltransferase [Rhizomicrobium sp.]|nr:GNAT family N-acetyltransferase [Rhizomicrobium sp.]